MDTEVHYLTYDPEELWKEMNLAYIAAGGDILYPGDEKEMLLRGVQAIVMQVFAGVDAALRMDTLRYAAGEYLDIYGETRNCARIQAAAAKCMVEITFAESKTPRTIPAGTALTVDGSRLYLLAEDVQQTGYAQAVTASIICQDTGGAGNGLMSGTQMQFMVPNPAVISIYTVSDASGGQDEEEDEAYRERIRTYGLVRHTTGTKAQYESLAMAVSSEILDAEAVNSGAGKVGIYLLLNSKTGADAIIQGVFDALNPQDVRTLTDTIEVRQAAQVPYVLNVQYAQAPGSNIASAVNAAVEEYRAWQDRTIGRAFNPDRLKSMIYQAGASLVVFGEGSHFGGGSAEYTEIDPIACCSGEITLAVMT